MGNKAMLFFPPKNLLKNFYFWSKPNSGFPPAFFRVTGIVSPPWILIVAFANENFIKPFFQENKAMLFKFSKKNVFRLFSGSIMTSEGKNLDFIVIEGHEWSKFQRLLHFLVSLAATKHGATSWRKIKLMKPKLRIGLSKGDLRRSPARFFE